MNPRFTDSDENHARVARALVRAPSTLVSTPAEEQGGFSGAHSAVRQVPGLPSSFACPAPLRDDSNSCTISPPSAHNLDAIAARLADRPFTLDVAAFRSLDEERRAALTQSETIKSPAQRRNPGNRQGEKSG